MYARNYSYDSLTSLYYDYIKQPDNPDHEMNSVKGAYCLLNERLNEPNPTYDDGEKLIINSGRCHRSTDQSHLRFHLHQRSKDRSRFLKSCNDLSKIFFFRSFNIVR